MEAEKRSRSPNYPAISLPDAIQKLRTLAEAIHNHAAPREVIARGMGYAGLSGASASAVSAVQKYGLLDRTGEEWRISQRGMAILHPHTNEERAQAIRDAAAEPKLFAELKEKFPGRVVHDDLIRNFLIRNGFAPGAVGLIIPAFRQTQQFVDNEAGGYDSGRELVPMEPNALQSHPLLPPSTYAAPGASIAAVPLPSGEPYRLSLSGGRLQGAFDLRNGADADEMIQAINAWKLLIKPPKAASEGEDAAD